MQLLGAARIDCASMQVAGDDSSHLREAVLDVAVPVSCTGQMRELFRMGVIPSLGINPEGRQAFGGNQLDF